MHEHKPIDKVADDDGRDEKRKTRVAQLDRCGRHPNSIPCHVHQQHPGSDNRRNRQNDDCDGCAQNVDDPLKDQKHVGHVELGSPTTHVVSDDTLERAPHPSKVLFVPVLEVCRVLQERMCFGHVDDPAKVSTLGFENPERVVNDVRRLLDQNLVQQFRAVHGVAAGNAVHDTEETLQVSGHKLVVPVRESALREPHVPSVLVRNPGDVLADGDGHFAGHLLQATRDEVALDGHVVVKNGDRSVPLVEAKLVVRFVKRLRLAPVNGELQDSCPCGSCGFSRSINRHDVRITGLSLLRPVIDHIDVATRPERCFHGGTDCARTAVASDEDGDFFIVVDRLEAR